jgi:thiol-disulfide isomerase/thioredoxin
MSLFERVRMPSFAGATAWLNSEPLGPAELSDHVVLVNFWTLTCINWLRQEPYVRAWSRAYKDDGLIVIGVHTPEFSFEREIERIKPAVATREIDYPVAVDDDYEIWSSFANHYWPALYFIGRDGMIRDQHFGEGRYKQSERTIQHLLGVERDLTPVEGTGVEAEADWDQLRTPETYLGDARGERRSSDAERLNHWALNGDWRIQDERVVAQAPGASIAFRFHARDAHAVLSPGPRDPIPLRVTLDGEPPGDAHGSDVDADGNGELREGRMYQLIRQPGRVEDRTLELAFLEPGAEAYSFTFG